MRKYTYLLALLLVLTLSAGCAQGAALKPGDHPPVELSAWVADWDSQRGTEEYRQLKHHLAGVSCFTASYDQDDKLVVPAEVRAFAKAARKEGQAKRYLSVANDWQDKTGRKHAKDQALLRRLLADDEHKESAVREMIAAAKEADCNGLELDYEAFYKDKSLLQGYLSLTYKLSAACLRENLDLRVVLEPGMPMDAGLCKGPEYVVMLYNLHGRHSGPGPKADGAFIRRTIQKMAAIPGRKGVALATGGCLWEDYGLLGLKKGAARFVDEAEAAAMVKAHNGTPERDEESWALHFSWQEKGHSYELWYADSETINAWIKAAADEGITDISLWRLGGNCHVKGIRMK